MAEYAVGTPVPRKEGRNKVTGKAIYVDDHALPGMLHGATVRTPCARGRISNISFAPEIPWNEFTIVTAKDIPGQNVVALIVDDQPYLVEQFFQHAEEPVLLLAHPDRYLLEEARRAVTIDSEPPPTLLTTDESHQTLKSFPMQKQYVHTPWAAPHFTLQRP